MTKFYTTSRCQALTREGKRCKRDATHDHGKLALCMKHFQASLARKLTKVITK